MPVLYNIMVVALCLVIAAALLACMLEEKAVERRTPGAPVSGPSVMGRSGEEKAAERRTPGVPAAARRPAEAGLRLGRERPLAGFIPLAPHRPGLAGAVTGATQEAAYLELLARVDEAARLRSERMVLQAEIRGLEETVVGAASPHRDAPHEGFARSRRA